MYNLTNRTILLGVTGGIAAYKAVDLASKLTQAEALVEVVMTAEATRFVAPLTFAGVTGRSVHSEMFAAEGGPAEVHVELGRRAEAMVIAPATATMIARLALGLAEDMVSLTALATTAPLVICPAMDSVMFEKEATQTNLTMLKRRGALIVGPDVGRLASGLMGAGRLVETEQIMGAVRFALGAALGDYGGRKVVVTAGGTQEPIDPVRYLANRSSGKMGYAVAEAARDRGASVVLVSGPTALPRPYGIDLRSVERATQMSEAVIAACEGADLLVMAAAVADYQPAEMAQQKLKRGKSEMELSLVKTPDILASVDGREGLIKVGFAAESENLRQNARKKLEKRGVHMIVANDVTREGSGFGTDTNEVILFDATGETELPPMSKYEVAQRILDKARTWLAGG